MTTGAQKDVIKLVGGSAAAKLFGIASTMLFARLLTKDQMAVFPAFLMLAGLPVLFLTFGIFSAFIRDVPVLLRTDSRLVRSLIVTGSGVIILGTIVPTAAAYWWSDKVAEFVFRQADDGWIIRTMIPGFVAYMISKIAENVMWGRGQFGETSIVQIIESIVRPLATMTLYFSLGLKGIVIGLVTSQFIIAGVGFWYIRDIFIGPLPPLYPLGKLFSASMPYYIGNYLAYLRGDGDTFLVTALLGPVALAEYYLAKSLYSNVCLIWTAVDKVAVERLARFGNSASFNEKVRQLHVRISQTTIPFALFVIATAPGLIMLLGGSRYAGATGPAILLLVMALIQFAIIPVDRAVYIAVPGFLRVASSILEATLVVGTALLLAPSAGLMGVATARIIAPLGYCVFGVFVLYRRFGLSLPFNVSFLALMTGAPGTLLALFMTPAAHGLVGALERIALAAVIWAVSFLVVGYLANRVLVDFLADNALRYYRVAKDWAYATAFH